jgi:hypothetical protein
MANKFIKSSPKKEKSELELKLEVLATELVDEARVSEDPAFRLAALKASANYLALSRKQEPPFQDGAAFNEYRKKLSSGSPGGGGSGGTSATVHEFPKPSLRVVEDELFGGGESEAEASAGLGDGESEDGAGGEQGDS